MDDDVKDQSVMPDAPEDNVDSSASENIDNEQEQDDFFDVENDDSAEDNSEETEAIDTTSAQPLSRKERNMAELGEEIDELKTQLGTVPNGDVRYMRKQRDFLREITNNNIKREALDLEQKLLSQENPETGYNYSPEEAATIARNAEIEAQRASFDNQQNELLIENNQNIIRNEVQSALTSSPMFSPTLPSGQPNPQFNPAAAEMAGLKIMESYIRVPVLDNNGQPVYDERGIPQTIVTGIIDSPADILKSVASQFESYSKDAEGRAAQNLSRQAASADVRLSGNTTPSRNDPEMADFDEHFGL